jgi:SET domain-containing protein
MLLIKTRLGESAIHGLGLFAGEAIARGTVVWRFTPGFDLDADRQSLDELDRPLRDYLLHYGYIDVRTGRFVLCCDHARFINHSDAPNIGPVFDSDPHGTDIALRDIAAGEEITTDYALIEDSRPDQTRVPDATL